MADEEITEPTVGMPATINYVTDTRAAVVVKVNAKSVVVQPVATGAPQRINHPAEPFPCMAAAGITDRPIGQPQRFRMVAPFVYRNGSIGLTLGRSVSITDWRD